MAINLTPAQREHAAHALFDSMIPHYCGDTWGRLTPNQRDYYLAMVDVVIGALSGGHAPWPYAAPVGDVAELREALATIKRELGQCKDDGEAHRHVVMAYTIADSVLGRTVSVRAVSDAQLGALYREWREADDAELEFRDVMMHDHLGMERYRVARRRTRDALSALHLAYGRWRDGNDDSAGGSRHGE